MSIAYVTMATGFILIIIGFYGAMTNRNIVRMIVGFTIAATGTNLVLIAVGYIPNRTAPILDEAVAVADAASSIVDPVPQALVLTAIVIGLGVTALMLAFAYKIHASKGTLDISKLTDLKW